MAGAGYVYPQFDFYTSLNVLLNVENSRGVRQKPGASWSVVHCVGVTSVCGAVVFCCLGASSALCTQHLTAHTSVAGPQQQNSRFADSLSQGLSHFLSVCLALP